MKRTFALLLLAGLGTFSTYGQAGAPNFQSAYLRVGFAPTTPAFSWFAVDSLGNGENLANVVLTEKLPLDDCALKTNQAKQLCYTRQLPDGREINLWCV